MGPMLLQVHGVLLSKVYGVESVQPGTKIFQISESFLQPEGWPQPADAQWREADRQWPPLPATVKAEEAKRFKEILGMCGHVRCAADVIHASTMAAPKVPCPASESAGFVSLPGIDVTAYSSAVLNMQGVVWEP